MRTFRVKPAQISSYQLNQLSQARRQLDQNSPQQEGFLRPMGILQNILIGAGVVAVGTLYVVLHETRRKVRAPLDHRTHKAPAINALTDGAADTASTLASRLRLVRAHPTTPTWTPMPQSPTPTGQEAHPRPARPAHREGDAAQDPPQVRRALQIGARRVATAGPRTCGEHARGPHAIVCRSERRDPCGLKVAPRPLSRAWPKSPKTAQTPETPSMPNMLRTGHRADPE